MTNVSNEIYTAFMPRMTLENSFRSQLYTASEAMFLNGLLSVVRTRRVEAALTTDQQTQSELVDSNQLDDQFTQHLVRLV